MNDLIVYVLAASATKVRHAKKKKNTRETALGCLFLYLVSCSSGKKQKQNTP